MKLSCIYGEIIGSEVYLRLNSSASGDNKICTIRLLIPGNDLLASSQYKKFEIAIVQTVEALKRQIKKRKTKIEGRQKKNPKELLLFRYEKTLAEGGHDTARHTPFARGRSRQ